MTNAVKALAALILLSAACQSAAESKPTPAQAPQPESPVTIRTENHARPPYSGATYFFYEKAGQVICTKLEVCNKFGECSVDYKKGLFREEQDNDPFDKTSPTPIPPEKLRKHRCLTKFGLVK